jgi:addiction module RelE/StbE family toxin
MRVIVTPQAREELREHIAYIARHNPDAAKRTRARIIGRIRVLRDHPMTGRPGRAAGTRELVITGTRYLAIYTIIAETVYIVHINHGAQQWPLTEDESDEE